MTAATHRLHRIGMVAKPGDPGLAKTVTTLAAFLRDLDKEIIVDPNAAEILGETPATPVADFGDRCDLAVVVGGDGTLLSAARDLVDHDIPVVGINQGRLGFLVDISPDHMLETVAAILAGNYQEDRRFLLSAKVGDHPPVLALNDVVVHKWNVARMIEFETTIDGARVDVQRSDGLIISTPTGSTAYALSGGGPLLSPNLNAISLVPICPHTLSNRPIVVHGSCKITVTVSGRTDPDHVRITCDGQAILKVAAGEILSVRKHTREIRLFHPLEHDHCDLMREKLGWGGQRH